MKGMVERVADAGAGVGADLAAGFGLLTRLPVGWLVRPGRPFRPGRAVWCYPLAGGLLGAIGGGCLLACRSAGLPATLAAGWTLLVSVLLTGGLHEDGLADLADGCGGGRTPERRLEIMRDSRIGAFGALALLLCLLLRFTALQQLVLLPARATIGWLIGVGALSRMAMLPVLMLPPARSDGLGRSLGAIARPVWLLALGSGAVLAVLAVGGRWASLAIAAAMLTGWLTARYALARLGGRTGDVLGACVMAAECVLLTLAARSASI